VRRSSREEVRLTASPVCHVISRECGVRGIYMDVEQIIFVASAVTLSRYIELNSLELTLHPAMLQRTALVIGCCAHAAALRLPSFSRREAVGAVAAAAVAMPIWPASAEPMKGDCWCRLRACFTALM